MFKLIIYMYLCLWSLNATANIKKMCDYKTEEFAQMFSAPFKKIMAEIRQDLSENERLYGTCKEILHIADDDYEMILLNAKIPLKIKYDRNGIIIGFRRYEPVLINDSFEKIKSDFQKLSGSKSIIVRQVNGGEYVEINSKNSMPIASSMKFYVLKALMDSIKQGVNKWDTVVKLDKKYKTLPSGILQNWPNDSNLTLQTLANLMISMSDNTATDLLINHLGISQIEKIMPQEVPLLTIGQAFKIESLNALDQEKYLQLSLVEKRQFLKNLITHDVDESMYRKNLQIKNNKVIGWFASVNELCQVADEIRKNESLQIIVPIIKKSNWDLAAFKGGSQPGVIQMTFIVEKDSKRYCVSASNRDDKEVDEKQFAKIVQRVFALLKTTI